VRLIPAAIVGAVLMGAAGCTSSSTSEPGVAASRAAATPQDSRPAVALTGTPSATECGWEAGRYTDVPTYRGMTVASAKDRAISEGLTVREWGADGTCVGGTQDYRPSGRVNFYSEGGVVVWAQLF
jgi:hypothetical protein